MVLLLHFVPKTDQTRILQGALRASQSFTPIGIFSLYQYFSVLKYCRFDSFSFTNLLRTMLAISEELRHGSIRDGGANVCWRNRDRIAGHRSWQSTTSPKSKSLRHPLLLHSPRICLLPNRHLFALAACGRLAGVRTQVDMSRLAGSKSKSNQRGKRGHTVSGLNKATQDFEQAARASVRYGRGAA
jgi:hypothetical protein